ncbi:MAG: hypothetical protein IT495_12915 [Gammaproteobacteria bacterium]|nr:hypothetical protein [Gammaproteobacteria bacterium]
MADPLPRYEALRASIRAGAATGAEVREALTERDALGLSNTVLQLYYLREDAGVRALLEALWSGQRDQARAAAWDTLATAPVRVALAHTLARIDPGRRPQLLAFIRASLASRDEFAQAQAALALAFVGDHEDLPALEALARSGGDYAAEAALKALAIRGGDTAHQAMLRLQRHYRADAQRSAVIRQLLAERWPPVPGQPP